MHYPWIHCWYGGVFIILNYEKLSLIKPAIISTWGCVALQFIPPCKGNWELKHEYYILSIETLSLWTDLIFSFPISTFLRRMKWHSWISNHAKEIKVRALPMCAHLLWLCQEDTRKKFILQKIIPQNSRRISCRLSWTTHPFCRRRTMRTSPSWSRTAPSAWPLASLWSGK